MNEQKEFRPYIPVDKVTPEITATSVVIGIALAVVLRVANAYLGLCMGMTISVSTPAVVIVMGVIRHTVCKKFILESNLVQTIDSARESLTAGVASALLALFLRVGKSKVKTSGILKITPVAFIGGILGVLPMVPLRNALVVGEYGILPYPGGMACAGVLLAGEEGGVNALTIFADTGIAAIFKFTADGLKLVPNEVSLRVEGYAGEIGTQIYPAVMGAGYICRPRISSYMFVGGTVSWLILISAVALFGTDLTLYPETEPIERIFVKGDAGAIWGSYIRYIGADALAAGGIISLVRSLPLTTHTSRDTMKGLTRVRSEGGSRTNQDLNMRLIIVGIAILILLIRLMPVIPVTLMGVITVVILGFFSATVSSGMVGLVGSGNNPVSGMAIATLLIITVILKMTGDSGIHGMQGAIVVGSIICIVAAIAGNTSQDLETGYLLGVTPKKQQVSKFVGVILAAFAIGGVLYLLNAAWGFGFEEPGASQTMLMKMTIGSVMENNLPRALVFMGVFLVVVVEVVGTPVLPSAIGVYLPIQLNACITVDGPACLIFNRMKREEREKETIVSSGLLYCSGTIAREGLVGILLVLLAVFGLDKAINLSGMLNLPVASSNIGSLVVFGLVMLVLFKFSLWKRRKTV